jgi:hypothetical protein
MITAFDLIVKYTPFYYYATPCLNGNYYIGYWMDAYKDGTKVKKDDTISEQDAQELLKFYLNKIELPEGSWTDNQKEALKSLIYYMQFAWDESEIKKAIDKKDYLSVREEWEKLRDTEVFENNKPWKQEEINLFFGE